MAKSNDEGIDWTSLIISGAATAANAYANSRARKSDREANEHLTKEEIAARARLQNQEVAARESLANPFRQQLDQAAALKKLDRLERGRYTPVRLSAPAGMESYIPHLFGGSSYEKSPELVSSAAALKRNVMGGNVAPTMTDPNNYGRTAALDLVSLLADGQDPATVNASRRGPYGAGDASRTPPGSAGDDYFVDTARRGGGTGGVGSNAAKYAAAGMSVAGPWGAAAGAVGGAIKGAVQKHAASAPTDFAVSDASTILDRAIRSELGRAPNPGEIQQLLVAQGWQPGDRWVGQAGLNALINGLRTQRTAAAGRDYTAHG